MNILRIFHFNQLQPEVKKNISRLIACAIVIGFAIGCTLSPITGYDWYNAFLISGQDPFAAPYLSWLFLVFSPITKLPFPFAWFTGLNAILVIISLFLVEKPSPWLVLNLPLLWIFFYGQIDGWTILGAVLGLWAIKHSKPYLVGLALLALVAKPHIGIPLALYYFWKNHHIKTLVIPVSVAIISFIFYGFWPIKFIQGYLNTGVYNFFVSQQVNMSLWPWSLAVLPVILWKWKSMSMEKQVISILAVTCLILPYSPVYSLAALIFMISPCQELLFLLIPAWFGKVPAAISGTIFTISSLGYALFIKDAGFWKKKEISKELDSTD